LQFPGDMALAEQDRSCPLVSTSKILELISRWSSGTLWWLGLQTCIAVKYSPLR